MHAGDLLEALEAGPILLYDGECGVCNLSVQWILAHEKTARPGEVYLRFAALQSELAMALKSEAGLDHEIDSLIWAEKDGSGVAVHIYSSAVVQVLRTVGGSYSLLAALLWLIPKPLRDLGYRLFASVRKQVVSEQCLVPSPANRKRFLIDTAT
jgi:predicted DCC family thiol-disulfide oxidoreductase YuxK